MWLPSHSRLLRRNDDGCLDAFKIARGPVGLWVFALEILRGFDGQLPLVIVGPGLAVDRDLPARAGSSSSSTFAPVLLRLSPDRRRRRVLDLNHIRTLVLPRPITRAEPLRHDALAAELAGVGEDDI